LGLISLGVTAFHRRFAILCATLMLGLASGRAIAQPGDATVDRSDLDAGVGHRVENLGGGPIELLDS